MKNGQSTRRKILKFSHYSMAIVLPKAATSLFGWQPGDELMLTVDEATHQVVLSKPTVHQQPVINVVKAPDEQPRVLSNHSETMNERALLPIPELSE